MICDFFSQFFHELIRLLQRIEIIYHHHWLDLLLLFCCLSNQENLYMIHHGICYGLCKTITKSKIKSLPFVNVSNPVWRLERSDWKNSAKALSALLWVMISMLLLFKCITRSWSMPLEETKVSAIVNWIFHGSDFLRLFMMSFKYGLVSSKYSLIYRDLMLWFIFLSPLLSYSI